jgi:hypothetical protein
MPNVIQHPKSGGKVKPDFLVFGHVSPSVQTVVAYLEAADGSRYYGVTLPRTSTKWAAIFCKMQPKTGPYDLVVLNGNGGAELGRVKNLSIGTRTYGINIDFPTDPGPYCPDGFYAYGTLSGSGTLDVVMTHSSLGAFHAAYPNITPDGFWYDAFDTLPETTGTDTYTLTATYGGASAPPVTGILIQSGAC